MYAEVSSVYPNRIALYLEALSGPLLSTGLGWFNPGRDLQMYVNGAPLTVQSWNFDLLNNRYLIFVGSPIDPTDFVQVVHHMPAPPFMGGVASALGFGMSFGTSFGS